MALSDESTFDLSGAVVALRGSSADLRAAIEAHWAAFRVAPRASWLDVTLCETDGPFGSGRPLTAVFVGDGGVARFETPEGRITVDGVGRAELVLARGPLNERLHALVNLVLSALATEAPARGLLVVHAAGIVIDGLGFALVGPAGSGKTTWLEIAARTVAPISDDLVGVDVAGAHVEILALPFRRAPSPAAGPGRWPLRAILVPAHGPAHRLEAIDPRIVRAAVVANLPHLPPTVRTAPVVTAAIDRLLREVALRRLVFARDPGFLDPLRALAACAER